MGPYKTLGCNRGLCLTNFPESEADQATWSLLESQDKCLHQKVFTYSQASPLEGAYNLKRHHQKVPIRHFKRKPAEPTLSHYITSEESVIPTAEESSRLQYEAFNEKQKKLIQETPQLSLVARGIYPSPLSLPSPELDARGIFEIIVRNLNPLILQPTIWIPKETILFIDSVVHHVPILPVRQPPPRFLGSRVNILASVQVQEESPN